MKKIIISLLFFLPICAFAQGSWTAPAKSATPAQQVETKVKKESNEKTQIVVDGKTYTVKTADLPYLKGAVPEVDGKVVYHIDLPLKGMKADEVYSAIYKRLEKLVSDPHQTEHSRIALVNEEEHSIVARIEEWMVFADKILVLDRALFNYVVEANCKDEMLSLTISRLYYNYNTNHGINHFTAEETITDELMLTKNGTKLRKVNSKFRKATVDRMNEVLKEITDIK